MPEKTSKSIHRYVKIIFGILMVLFAYFQLNDPDPFIWVTIYIIVATICFISAYYTLAKYVYISILIALIMYGLLLIPEFIEWINLGMPSIVKGMKAEEPHIEYMREFLGLAICQAIIFYCMKKN